MARKKRPDGFPKVTLKNIHRPEPKYFGWRVQFKRGRREHWKNFPDGPDGPFESLRAAIEWRDQEWARLGPPVRISPRNARNTSGVVGVQYSVTRRTSGELSENWIASWLDADRKRHYRAFSIDKYGNEDAFQRAVTARDAGVAATRKERHRRMVETLHTHQRMLQSKH